MRMPSLRRVGALCDLRVPRGRSNPVARCAAAVKRPVPHTGRLGDVRRCGRVGSGSHRGWRGPHFHSSPSGRPGSGRQHGVRPRRRPSLREGWFRLCPPSARSALPQQPIGSSRQRSTARCASSASSVAAGGLVPALCAVGDVRTSAAAHRVVSDIGRQHGVRPRRRPSLREGWFRLCAPSAMSVLPQRPIGSSPAAVDSMVCVLGVVRRCGWVGSGSVRRRRGPYFPSGPSGRLRQRSTAWCASSASSVAAGGLVPALCAVGGVRTSPAAHRVVSGSGRQHGVRPRRRSSLREGWFRLCAPSAVSVLPQRPIGSSPAAVDSMVCVTKGASLRPPTPEPHSTGGEPPPPLPVAAPLRATRPGGAGAGDPLDTPGSGPSANSRRGEFPGRDT